MAERDDSPRTDADILALARSLGPADAVREAPPADLWSRIERELGDELRPTAGAPSPAPRDRPPSGKAPSGTVVPMRRRRAIGIAGALAVAASISFAVWLAARPHDRTSVLAAAPLSNEGLASFSVTPTGSARLVLDRGVEYLDVAVTNAPSESGDYLELWLIDRQVKGMVSLGPYHGNGRYEVPPGVDPNTFPIVDISLEPADGVPTHSGVSVVRGTLPPSRH